MPRAHCVIALCVRACCSDRLLARCVGQCKAATSRATSPVRVLCALIAAMTTSLAADLCDGVSANCGADVVKSSGTVCVDAFGCFGARVCDGTHAACPVASPLPAGVECDAGATLTSSDMSCNVSATCLANGVCSGARPGCECFLPVRARAMHSLR
jgi:hypothetical protein